MSKPKKEPDDGWEQGWEEHRVRQLRRIANLPLTKKLEWLEQAQKLGKELIAQAPRSKQNRE